MSDAGFQPDEASNITHVRVVGVDFDDGRHGIAIEFKEQADSQLFRLALTSKEEALAVLADITRHIDLAWPTRSKGETH